MDSHNNQACHQAGLLLKKNGLGDGTIHVYPQSPGSGEEAIRLNQYGILQIPLG